VTDYITFHLPEVYSTDGGRRAPFALGDDEERVTRGLRIEGFS